MTPDTSDDAAFDEILYQGALAEKHHYDNLSWTIGAIALVGAGVLIAGVTQVSGDTYLLRLPGRVALAALAVLLLDAWRRVYERNRFWAEVANEKLRDLERARGIERVTISFMKAALAHQVVLKNLDHTGKAVAEPHIERCRQYSMHTNINQALWLFMAITIGFAFLP